MKNRVSLLLSAALFAGVSFAQTNFNHPYNTGAQTVMVPYGSTINYYDNNGPSSSYSNNSNPLTSIITFKPLNPAQKVQVTFTSFLTENTYDALYIYNGDVSETPDLTNISINTTLPNQFNSGLPQGNTFRAGGYMNNTLPGTLTSTAASGALTFQFDSDGSITQAGWTATVTTICTPASGINDAGVVSIDSFNHFCPGTLPVYARVQNFGSNVINNLTVEWEFDGLPQAPVVWNSGPLDTCTGSGSSIATIFLGNKTFNPGTPHTIKAWTHLPNGVPDTENQNDTLSIIRTPGMGGTYTIGGSSPNFNTFTEAINALMQYGVCDSVKFNVRNGTYNEQISIGQIPGADTLKHVTFQSELGDSSLVILTFSANSTNNYTLRLNGADWVTFRKMTIEATNTTYGRAVEITNGSDKNKFRNCWLKSISTTSTGSGQAIVYSPLNFLNQHNAFQNNRFTGGSFGIFYEGHANNNNYVSGTKVENNQFLNQYYQSIYLYRHNNPLISGNLIQTNSAYTLFYGVWMTTGINGGQVTKNKVVIAPGSGRGMSIESWNGTVTSALLVANNYISVGGTAASYGIYNSAGAYQNYVYNSVHLANNQSDSYAFYSTTGSNKTALNNIFSNFGGGYAIGLASSGAVTSDYNDLFATGASVGTWLGNNQATLANWQTASSSDAHSISVNPQFVSSTNFPVKAIELNSTALAYAPVTTDIEGQARHATTPDIGADEFTPTANDAQLLAFTSPQMPLPPGTVPVEVVLKNNGTAALTTASINWEINATPQTAYSWTGNLLSGAKDTVIIGSSTFSDGGTYNLEASTLNPNGSPDPNPANDTIYINNLLTALAGTYTVGGTTPNFATFTLAVNALHQRGVSAPVTFNVRNGTYTEQLSINPIIGASAANPVIFQSESGDSSSVTLTFSSNATNNFTIRLNGTDWLTFQKLTLQATNTTYGRVVEITGGADQNTFKNNWLKGAVTTTTAFNPAIVYSPSTFVNQNNSFLNNRFTNGSYGIAYEGHANNNNYIGGTIVENNIFENQYDRSVYLYRHNNPIVSNNLIQTNTPYTFHYGIWLSTLNNGAQVKNNKIILAGAGPARGMSIETCSGTVSNPLIVANNFVFIGGTGASYGIYASSGNYLNFIYNTVSASNTQAGTYAFFTTGGGNNLVINNLFSNSGGGYAVGISSGVISSDYNDFFTSGPVLGLWNGVAQSLLTDWQTTSGYDVNSISVNPLFVNPNNYPVTAVELNGAANPTVIVSTDIEGHPRHATDPDIGADEFTPPTTDAALIAITNPTIPFAAGTQPVNVVLKNNGVTALTSVTLNWTINAVNQTPFNWVGSLGSGSSTTVTLGTFPFVAGTTYNLKAWSSTPNGGADGYTPNDTTQLNNLVSALAGVYTIGGASPDFASFTTAVNALHSGGVAGAVTFNVRNGTYNEQISINQILGASSVNTITFQSESGDSSQVILQFAANTNANHTIQLNGTDWMRFRKMTLKALTPDFNRVAEIFNGSNNLIFSNCLVDGINNTGSVYTTIYIHTGPNEFITFQNNYFKLGWNAVAHEGSFINSSYSKGLIIRDNVFDDQANVGVWARLQDNIQITGNKIFSGQYGIYIDECYLSGRISENIIYDVSIHGIWLDMIDGTAANPFLTANNFVSVPGTAAQYGIYVNQGNYHNIYNNSVNLTNTNTGSRAFFSTSGSNKKVFNNIFSNTGGGYAYYNATGSAIPMSDFNNLHATGTNIGNWNGANYTTLAAWKTGTGKDANSISVNPQFVSATNLHTTNSQLNNKGTPLPQVTVDIDGDTRDPVKPDIGADEFFTSNEDAGVATIERPVMPFPAGLQPVVATIFNNGLDTLETVVVNWQVNGVTQTPLAWAGSLLSGESQDSVALGSFVFEINTPYTIKAWTSLPNGINDTLNLNDTTKVMNLYAALSGVYTIGGTTPDFPTFQAAVTAMTNGGVVGPVTFNVRNGTYTEQISIPQINGASTSNTITFQSESGDSISVTLQFGSTLSTANYTLRLDGADWFRFRKMTLRATATVYTRVVHILNGANDNKFENNEVVGYNATSTSTQYALIFSDGTVDNNNSFRNNRLLEGSIGIYLFGIPATHETGTIIEGNTVKDHYYVGIHLSYHNAPLITNNEIYSSSVISGYIGINAAACSNAAIITYNFIHSTPWGYGIQLNSNAGTSGFRGLTANNFVSLGINNTNDGRGIYLVNCSFQNIYHNNVNWISTDDANTYAFFTSGSSNLNVKNNIFVTSNKGRAFYKTSSSNIFSDYNDLFTGTGANLGYWEGTNVANLAAWRTTSGQDAHSLSIDPIFTSNSDLHVAELDLNSSGTPVPQVTTDFDGESRSLTTPDIGADEFSPIVIDDASVVEIASPNKTAPFPAGSRQVEVVLKNNGANPLTTATIQWRANGLQQAPYAWSGVLMPGERDTFAVGNHNFTPGFGHDLTAFSQFPNGMTDNNPSNDTAKVDDLHPGLNGIYTIGGAFPDFSNFSAAANTLNLGGVLGPVTFNVRNGTYDNQIILNQIAGASATNTITFQSQNGDSSLVKMRNPNSSTPDYIVQLNGADFVTFKKITFQTTGCCITAMIELTNGANNNKVQNCHFIAPVGNTQHIVFSNGNSLDNDNTIENNRLENGGRGVAFYGQSTSLLESGNFILNNVILNTYYDGIIMYYQNSPRIDRNNISSSSVYNSFQGIFCGYCDNAARVLTNRISAPGGTGIRLYNSDGTSAARGLTANNFVKVGGTVTAYGIYSDNSNFQNYYYNSTHLNNTSANSRALYVVAGANLNFLNNIYANTGGGYAAYVSTSGVASSNFNNFYKTGTNLGYWNGATVTNLTGWQAASSKDFNSVSANPLFYSPDDLHVLQVALDSAATVIANINTDFDGQPRNANFPDIGADEFNYVTDDLGVIALLTPVEDCNLSNTEQVKVRIQNYGGLPQTGFSIGYRLNYGTPVVENVGALVVPPGGTADYTFTTPANMSAYIMHELELYTVLSGDLNADNDEIEVYVQNFPTPSVVANMLPANGTLNIDPPVNFSWLPSIGATRYDLFVWKSTDPVPTTPVATDITQITYAYNTSNWIYGATYNWKLIAKNNFCETPGPVQSFTLRELPDLIVQSVQPPNMPFSGQSIEVTWQVKNNGLGATGMTTWYDYIYLSTDNVYQPTLDTYLGGFSNFTALNANGTYSNMKNVTLPNGIQGTYYIFVVTDRNNSLIEGNNNNNTSAAASMVVNLTPPPDLQVTGFITPSNAFSGTSINVSWTVSNEGTGDVPAGDYFSDYIYLSNQPTYNPNDATFLGSYFSAPLAEGASHQRTKQVSIPNGIFGNHYIHVVTDRFNDVFEFAFESNNTGTSNAINIILTPPPNLKVTSVVTPDTTSNGQQITMQWTVANQGANSSGNGWSDRVYMSPTPVFNAGTASTLGTFSHNSALAAGANVVRTGTVTIPSNVSGKRYLFVETDVYNGVFEYVNENDNLSTKDSTFVRNTDLIVTQVAVADTLHSGTSVTVSWTVQNVGLGTLATVSRTDRIYISTNPVLNPATATEVGSISYNTPLTPGQTLSRQATVSIPNGIFGSYHVHVLTDANNSVFENAAENNNTNKDATLILLSPWPDLRVDTLTGLPDTTLAGTLLNLHFIVHNYGTAPVQGISGGWKDRVYLSPNPVWNLADAELLKTLDVQQPVAIGATYNIGTTFTMPLLQNGASAGVFYIYVFTDGTNKVYEYIDEGNNLKRSHPIYVTTPPPVDFEVLTATSLADTLNSGQGVSLLWSVKNIGNNTAVWNYPLWYDGFYLSVDSTFDMYDDIFVKDFTKNGPVGSNQTYSLNQSFNIPNGISGNYYAFLVADHAELTNDANRANNVKKIAPADYTGGPITPIVIELTPSPDFAVNSMVVPTSGVSGQPVQVIWTVTNTGPGTTSGTWTDKIYLSTDFTIAGNDVTIGSKNQTRVLATGQSYTDTMYAIIPITSVGNFVVIFKTDANNVVFENNNNESNNTFFNYITTSLPLPSDLVANTITFPSMAMVGESFSVSYKVKNVGSNPATGMMKDIVYFSADSAFDASDIPYVGPYERTINIAPNGELMATVNNLTPGVPLGNYFIIVQTDALNNIYENSDANNVTISTSQVMVTVQQLLLGVLTPDTLMNGMNLYYRIEIPDTLGGETMLVTLDGNTPQGINELYLSFNEVPTRSVHDFSFPNPFAPDQSIVIPEIQEGQYYLLAYGNTNYQPANGKQMVDLKAEIIPFQILDVDAEQGGNTGNVTVRIDGAKFTADMEVSLYDAALGEVVAHTLTLINSTRAFVTFNLAGKALGIYDVRAEKTGGITTTLPDGFQIVAGGPGTTTGSSAGGAFFCDIINIGTGPNLSQNVMHPPSVRVNRVVPITIQFGNSGNTDIPCPSRFLLSLRGAPLSFDSGDFDDNLQELYIEFQEQGGPPGVLRPGALSQITVYSFSSHPLGFLLTE